MKNWFGHLILILEDVPKKLMVVFAVVGEDVREWAALDFESTSVNLDNQNVTEEILFEGSVLRLGQIGNLARHHFEMLRSDLWELSAILNFSNIYLISDLNRLIC